MRAVSARSPEINMRARIGRFLKTRDGQCAFGLIAAFAFAFGYFFIRTYVSPPPPHFDLDFGAARWLEPEKPSPVAYFRQEIFLPNAVQQAWMQIGATDSFELFVNGAIVATNEFDATNPSGVFDLKTLLQPGHNAIGVRVIRTTYPEPARVIARLSTKSAGGPVRDFFTDATWRASPNTALVPPDSQWCSTAFDAKVWKQAKLATRFDPHVNQVDLDPRVLASLPQGQWLTSPNPTAREQGFIATFDIADARRGAWLQIAATGDYELIVNGRLRALETLALATGNGPAPPPTGVIAGAIQSSNPSAANSATAGAVSASMIAPAVNATMPTPPPPSAETLIPLATQGSAMSAAVSPSPPTIIQQPGQTSPLTGPTESDNLVPVMPQIVSGMALQAYYLTPWLRHGANNIIVRVRAPRGAVAMLADGFTVQANGAVKRFTGDGVWRAVTKWAGRRAVKTASAVGAGAYGEPPWGFLPQTLAMPLAVPLYDSGIIALWTAGYLAIFAAIFAFSFLCSYFLANVKGIPFEEALSRDALLHAPALCAMLFLWLVSYDYRLPVNFAFQGKLIAGITLLLLAVRVYHVFPSRRTIPPAIKWPRVGKILLLIGIVATGALLRFHGLAAMSLDHDEMTLVRMSHGIARKGIPNTFIGSQEHILTTYELATYFIAAASALLGNGEWAVRMPSCLFGISNIVLLAWVGRKIFDWRVGWFTALIYAVLPLDIRWAQNAFWPSQAQFFSTLTFWCFYEAIRRKPFQPNYLRASAFAFCAAYLSWEGAGFIVPVLFVSLVTVRWGEFWWLRDGTIYRCLFWMTFVVASQLCIRFLVHDTYLMVGVGLSTVSTPSLFFLDSNFDPYYYFKKLLLSENHVLLTGAICFGVFVSWKNAGIRYLFVVIVGLLMCYTALLSAYAPRYCLFYQPLLLLLGSAVVFVLLDHMSAFARRMGGSSFRGLNHACMASFVVIVFFSTNPWFIKAYRLCAGAVAPGVNVRMGTYRVDYRGVSNFVKANMRPGDAVIPGIPHVYEYYTGNTGGYFLNSLLVLEIFYEPSSGAPFYRDKFVGNPVIRDVNELREVVSRAPRTWIIQAPLQFAALNQPNVLAYLGVYGRVVFESYNSNVILIPGAGAENQQALFKFPTEPMRSP